MSDQQLRVLKIFLNDTDVGVLTLLPDDRTLFAFNESYINNSARPTLSLWFKTPLGELKTTEKIRSQAMLPPFFSNLLPEGPLRDYLAGKANVKPLREFFLLAALGQDLPGAVRAEPLDASDEQHQFAVREESFSEPRLLKFSLAGIQLKLSAVMEPTGGLTISVDGTDGSWIVKLPSSTYAHLPEAEYSMLALAKKVGITVPDFKLVSGKSIAGLPDDLPGSIGDCLAVKRFDRQAGGPRIHMEDFAQIFGVYPDQKYERATLDMIGDVIFTESGEDDFIEFIRRLVFTIAIGNGDMHLKNWSLLYPDTHSPRLSPAYDFIPTILHIKGDSLGLKLGSEKSFKQIRVRHFSKLASRAAASERIVLNTVQETAVKILDAWKEVRNDLPLPAQARQKLDTHIDNLPLLHE